MKKCAPPFTFFFLHLCTAWPVGVVGLALASSLVKAGVSVHQAAGIIAAATLAFTFEFLWAPMVDALFTRRVWYVGGSAVMCICLVALLVAPWDVASVPFLTALAFTSCSGAAVAAVAAKGLMAYDVPTAQLGAASGFYTAGGIVAKAVAGAGTLWLLTHLASRPLVASFSSGAAALAGAAVLFAAPGQLAPLREFRPKLSMALADLWNFIRTRRGVLIAVLCVIPFGAGTEAGLIGAIAREWAVGPDQLAAFGVLGAITSVAGAIFGGWLSTRIGPWRAYIVQGWLMIAVILSFAFAPRAAIYFLVAELLYRALASACYAALLGIVMTAIGKGAAATKAAAMWSLVNVAYAYPTLIEGTVHDRAGTFAMLLTDAGLGVAGFGILLVAARLLKVEFNAPLVPDRSRACR